MNLIFIYGPPGIGKLTVARALAALTGYRLFDSQATINCVKPVFDYSGTFWNVVNRIRLLVIEEAAREGVNLIVTEAYSHPKDEPGFNRTCKLVEGHGGRVCPVQLSCEEAVMPGRFQSQDRIRAGKTSSAEELRRMKQHIGLLVQPVPGMESLCIDNTNLSPEVVARQIAAHYSLPTS